MEKQTSKKAQKPPLNKGDVSGSYLFDKDLIARITVKQPDYAIGVDTYDKKALAYCFGRTIDGVFEILLSKTMRDRKEFDKEVNNLAAYFNAKVYKGVD